MSWTHTSALPEPWEWITGGEMLMTNGLSCCSVSSCSDLVVPDGLVSAVSVVTYMTLMSRWPAMTWAMCGAVFGKSNVGAGRVGAGDVGDQMRSAGHGVVAGSSAFGGPRIRVLG